MKKYPIGIQDFGELRGGGYIYVDKTRIIHHLIETGKYYFLSRPRRFGKSLLVSILKYLFQGKRELFKGLWIESRHNWESYPVLHISFSSIGYKELGLKQALDLELIRLAKNFNISLQGESISQKFRELLKVLNKKIGRVVLLIDEYDKPIVDYIDDHEKAEINRDILKSFFSVIKDADPFLRFFLITGVSKFSKVSLFSDLNHLDDITLAPDFGTLVGYTQEELESNFNEEIKDLGKKENISEQEIRDKIRTWYNGYRWGEEESVYNPFSILRLFRHKRFDNYWWDTGTPTFLIKKLRNEFTYDLHDIEAGHILFESYTLDNLDSIALLFQTGYLTLHDYDKEYRLYTLGYPNLEVQDTMHQHLLAAYRGSQNTESLPLLIKIKKALEKKELERFIELINTLFSSIPHQIFIQKQEAFFHAIMHLSFSGIGLLTQSEVSTAKGRVDTITHTKQYIYIMEFKLDDSSEAALAQIREKRYGSPFLNQGKEVIAIGVNFSSQEKSVLEWQSVPYESLLVEG